MRFSFPHATALAVCLIISFTINAQKAALVYKEVAIEMPKRGVQALQEAGMGFDHFHIDKQNGSIRAVIDEQDIAILNTLGIGYRVIVDDVTEHFNKHGRDHKIDHIHGAPSYMKNADIPGQACNSENYPTPALFPYPNGSMGGYLTFDEIVAHIDLLAATYPSIVSVKQSIGTSHEGRDIWAFKISDNPSVDEDEPEVLFTSLIHAREPMGAATNIFFMDYITENYASDPKIQDLINNHEIWFMPCLNPDGYVYNQTTNPNGGGLWRKNRRNNGGGVYGVDLNRNFDYQWGYNNTGSSGTPSSQTYRGPSPASEPETQAIQNFTLSHNIKTTFFYHSSGELLITPFGYSETLPPGIDGTIFDTMSDDIVTNNCYHSGTPLETVGYTVNGASDDYMYAVGGAYAMTPETATTFWPSVNLADDIGRENVFMNLKLILYAGVYAEVQDWSDMNVTSLSGNFPFHLKREGVEDNGSWTVSIESLEGIASVGVPVVVSDPGYYGTFDGNISYTLSPSIQPQDRIRFVWTWDNGDYVLRDTITKYYTPTVLLTDNCENFDNWTTSALWGLSGDSFEGTNSITDSPSGNYSSGSGTATLYLDVPLNLSNALEAHMTLWIKYDITCGEDYVQIAASPNGTGSGASGYTPLCGDITKPGGAKNLPAGEPVYHNKELQWQKETISLEDYLGQSNVGIRIRLFTNNGATARDGFYIDKLQVVAKTDNTPPSNQAPNASFTANPTSGVFPLSVSFDASASTDSDGTITNYDWAFGTGDTGSGVTSNYTFNNPGSYDVTLTVTDDDGATGTTSTTITVTDGTLNYCSSNGTNVQYEWIQNVSFGSISNNSGPNGGYADFTAQSASVNPGSSYPVTLTPGFASSTYAEFWSVWIDYNIDGDFDDPGEQAFTGNGSSTVNGNITIPASASSGATRMRVSMQWNATPPGPCATWTYGEVEDYTLSISAPCPQAGTACDDGDPNTGNDVEDGNCNCAGELIDCEGVAGGTALPGTACDDGDACTINDLYDANCGCAGTFQDSDGDGVCDADDQCPGQDDALIGTACDDGNECTINDVYDANCGCSGTPDVDSDNDGICDALDQCPGLDDALIGTACDDGDACTTGETYDANCNCSGGVFQDADSDGVCDANDQCPGQDDALIGTACDDGNACTINDTYDANCGCSGTFQDSDGDGVCDANDQCPGTDDAIIGTACDDGDACTTGDVYDNNCNCAGTFADADGDGVCDVDDKCPGVNDAIIGTACNDGDACTINDTYDDSCNCIGIFQDSDADGVCDANDQCPDFDDNLIGTACNDGDPNTVNDVWGADCQCAGVVEQCTYELINLAHFESGWGIWNDGGSDCRRSLNDNAYAYNSSYCVRLRDNTSTSVVTTDNLDLSAYEEITVDFTYYPRSMDNSSEDFWLQISTNGGASYTTVEEWNRDDEFVNDVRYFDNVVIPGPFTSNTRLRFRCDASANQDWVYLDDIGISGCLSPEPPTLITGGSNGKPSIIVEEGTDMPAINPEKVESRLRLSVYPNPANDFLTVEASGVEANQVDVKIFNMLGILVDRRMVDAARLTRTEIDIRQLQNGYYLLMLQTGNDQVTKRFMKVTN